MSKKIELDKNILYDLYIDQNLGATTIASKFDCSVSCVYNNLRRYNIVKPKEQIIRSKTHIKYDISLQDLNTLTIEQIMKKYNCSKDTVINNLKQNNLYSPKQKRNNYSKVKPLMLKYMLNNQDFSKQEILDKFIESNLYIINKVIKENNIKRSLTGLKKDKENTINKIKQTNLKKYGHKCSLQNKEVATKVKQTWLRKYGTTHISKSPIIQQKRNQTNLKRYGHINPMLSKQVQEKLKQTVLTHYGVDNPMKSKQVKEKWKQNYLQKTGYTHNWSNPTVREKCVNTYYRRTGYTSSFTNPEVKEKINKTLIQKYDTIYPTQNKVIKQKIRDTNNKKFNRNYQAERYIPQKVYDIISNKEKFEEYILNLSKEDRNVNYIVSNLGISYNTFWNKYRQHNCKIHIDVTVSNIELIVKNLLDKYNLKYIQKDRSVLKPQELDFYLPTFNIAIECNGIMFHNSTVGIYNNKPKIKTYHYNKTKECTEKGIHLIHLYEHQILDKNFMRKFEDYLLDLCDVNRININKTECIVKEIHEDVSKKFIYKYHLENYDKADIHIGLYYKEELIQVMTFKKLNNIKQYELNKICTKAKYNKNSGSKKLLNYFIKKYNPQQIIMYCNKDLFTGKMLEQLNFKKEGEEEIDYWWIKRNTVLSQNEIKENKLKKLLKKEYKEDLTVTQNMLNCNFLQVFRSGIDKYIYNNN